MTRLRLREIRKKAKLTQSDVSNELNITQSQYSRWESGVNQPNASQIIKLSELFNCTPNDLFGIQGAMSAAFDPLFEEYKEFVKKVKK